MKRTRPYKDDDSNEKKRQKIDNDLFSELTDALSEINIHDKGIEEITKSISNLEQRVF